MMSAAPDGFVRIFEAVSQLALGMWGGGLKRPLPVAAAKKRDRKLSVSFRPWRLAAGRRLRLAAVRDELAIYVVVDHLTARINRVKTSDFPKEPAKIPARVLKRLITSHGCFSDHPIRPSTKIAGGDKRLFTLLSDGLLVVREREFDAWYRSEREKGRWPSQQSRKVRIGRPTKQSQPLENAIVAAVNDERWSAREPIAKLQRVLVAAGHDVPSPDTLARLVDGLHRRTGDPGLLRTKRRRRRTQS